MLVRNYNDEIGASYAEAFGTADRGRGRALLPGQRDRVRVAARRRAAHPAAARRGRAAPGHRAALLVQPDRVPQRVDDGPRGARVPGGRLRRATGCRSTPASATATRSARTSSQLLNERLRGPHAARAVAARRPAAGGQHPHRAQPGALRGAARGARRDGRPGATSAACSPTIGRPRDEPGRAVPPFAVISGAQVQQALQGQREADRRAGRGHLPAARRRRLGEPAVVLPALPGPAVVPDHRAARLDRRGGPGGRPEVDLQLPGERGGGHPAGLGRADPQRPRHRLPVRLPGELDHQRHPDGRVGGAGRRLAQPGPAAARPGSGSSAPG